MTSIQKEKYIPSLRGHCRVFARSTLYIHTYMLDTSIVTKKKEGWTPHAPLWNHNGENARRRGKEAQVRHLPVHSGRWETNGIK